MRGLSLPGSSDLASYLCPSAVRWRFSFLALLDNTSGYVLNFEPHKQTYKISIEVGRSVSHSLREYNLRLFAKAFSNYMTILRVGKEKRRVRGGRGGGGGGGGWGKKKKKKLSLPGLEHRTLHPTKR